MLMRRLPDEVAHSSERRENNWTCGILEVEELLTSSHKVWTFGYIRKSVSHSQKKQFKLAVT